MLESAFHDVFYTILLGLDGSEPIGGIQGMHDFKGESGNQLSGKIEGHAYEYFQE